ncbi:MAG: GNAT family N-acetyltransferase, partial [Xanthobacteraceae bacterium]
PSLSHLAILNGAPFAYLQCYRNVDYPEWGAIIDVDGGVSVDLFIGDPACLRRGLGRLALGGYLRQVAFPSYPEETRAYISHELINTAALKCSQAVGFRPLRRFLEHGLEMMLLALDREP